MRWWGSLSEKGGQGLDVVHCVAEDVHLAHLLHTGCSGYVPLQHIESVIDALDAVAFPGVSSRDLHILRRGDRVPMHWVKSHQPRSGLHGVTETNQYQQDGICILKMKLQRNRERVFAHRRSGHNCPGRLGR